MTEAVKRTEEYARTSGSGQVKLEHLQQIAATLLLDFN